MSPQRPSVVREPPRSKDQTLDSSTRLNGSHLAHAIHALYRREAPPHHSPISSNLGVHWWEKLRAHSLRPACGQRASRCITRDLPMVHPLLFGDAAHQSLVSVILLPQACPCPYSSGVVRALSGPSDGGLSCSRSIDRNHDLIMCRLLCGVRVCLLPCCCNEAGFGVTQPPSSIAPTFSPSGPF